MHFVEYRVPSSLDHVRRIMAIPQKKIDERLVDYLTRPEIAALLEVPDPTTEMASVTVLCFMSAWLAGCAFLKSLD
jgi:hypothetical protein